jgi:hypothetical protein
MFIFHFFLESKGNINSAEYALGLALLVNATASLAAAFWHFPFIALGLGHRVRYMCIFGGSMVGARDRRLARSASAMA